MNWYIFVILLYEIVLTYSVYSNDAKKLSSPQYSPILPMKMIEIAQCIPSRKSNLTWFSISRKPHRLTDSAPYFGTVDLNISKYLFSKMTADNNTSHPTNAKYPKAAKRIHRVLL